MGTGDDGDRAGDATAPVLVAVMNRPDDLVRAAAGWYRIPFNAPARQLAAEYIAFYQTGAFPRDERWTVRYYAPVRGYHITTRRELIPEEPAHRRAGDPYYRVDLGPLLTLKHPVPSRRLRRITFINTTLDRLLAAREINDLWIKTPAQALLWEALQEAQLEAEAEYPLVDEIDDGSGRGSIADFALFCREGRIAVIVTGEPDRDGGLAEQQARREYLLARGRWHMVPIPAVTLAQADCSWLAHVESLVRRLGNLEPVAAVATHSY